MRLLFFERRREPGTELEQVAHAYARAAAARKDALKQARVGCPLIRQRAAHMLSEAEELMRSLARRHAALVACAEMSEAEARS